jgi:hypothetical protein
MPRYSISTVDLPGAFPLCPILLHARGNFQPFFCVHGFSAGPLLAGLAILAGREPFQRSDCFFQHFLIATQLGNR